MYFLDDSKSIDFVEFKFSRDRNGLPDGQLWDVHAWNSIPF